MWFEKLQALTNNDGMTLKNGEEVTYKTGYQVADYGIECKTVEEAAAEMEKMGLTCGVWYSDGVYYIDHSFRVKLLKDALKIGREHNQISILKWSDMSLIYC